MVKKTTKVKLSKGTQTRGVYGEHAQALVDNWPTYHNNLS